jgi:HSP20 family protein
MVTSALAPKPQPAPAPAASPVRRPVDGADLMRYFSHEFDHMMRDLGVRERWPFLAARGDAAWVPDLEVMEQDGALKVRVDLPGMKAEEVKVSVTDAGFTIEGERRQQKSRTENGYGRSERSYGRFCRSVPLPEGARTDTAKASFADGVLEITVAIAPPQPAAVRTLEITSAGGSTPA